MPRFASLAALLIACALLTAPPASAETRSFSDPRRDVGHNLDIHRVTVAHGDRLVVKVKFREIVPGGLGIWVDTGGGPGPDRMWGGGVGGETDWQVWRTDGWRRTGSPMLCASDMRRNETTDVLTATFSRACLGGTGRVRVSVETQTCLRKCATWDPVWSAKDFAPARHRYYRWVARD